jgi:signal transduction histidine kinase
MALRWGLLAGWLVLIAVPAAVWWWRARRRVDGWRHLPVPGAILRGDGRRVAVTGPGLPPDWPPGTDLPAPGTLSRQLAPDGTPLAASGVAGGAVLVAVEADPGLARRHRRLSALTPLVQHELRGGLHALLGQLALARRAAPDGPAGGRLAACHREAERLIDLVDGAELLARLSTEEPVRHPVSAARVVGEAAAGLDDRLRVQLPDPAITVSVTPWQIIRALRNLAANALLHTRGPVLVEAHLGGVGGRVGGEAQANSPTGSVVFAVHDAGPGLSAPELVRLSEPFVRGSSDQPGSGLGLAVASAVLAGHGSRLETWRTDAGPAIGFTLPAVAAVPTVPE